MALAAQFLIQFPRLGTRRSFPFPSYLNRNGGGGSSFLSSSSSCTAKKNYLELSDEELMRDCEMNTFKSSGPGGQHRNKRESAVRLKHLPTGVTAQAVEDRSQHKNRASALKRLRTLLALKGC